MRWRAVWFGVGVAVLLSFFLAMLPLLGHAAVGLAAGFVGGVLAGGGPRPGAEHGLAVAAVGGLLSIAVGVVVGAAIGVTAAVPPVVRSAFPLWLGDAWLTVAGAVLFVVWSVPAGALGGWLRGDTEFPGRLENERAVR